MIIRIFHAQVQPGANAAFERLVREDALPLMKRHKGLLALHVGRTIESGPDEYVMVSVWADLDSMKIFTGENWRQAVVLPGEADLIKETRVEHFGDL